jgi:FkbM family methyltransferase
VLSSYRWWGPQFWTDLTADLLYYHYRYQPKPGDLVIDVGAGMGEELPSLCDAVSIAGTVIAIEAHPFTCKRLQATIALNGLVNCSPVWAAISDVSGTASISDGENLATNSTTASFESGPLIEVPAYSLDDLVVNLSIDRVDLLKMNIEGAERLAISGMNQVLSITRNVVISCHDFLAGETGDDTLRTMAMIIEALESAGFEVETRNDVRPFVADYVYAQNPNLRATSHGDAGARS